MFRHLISKIRLKKKQQKGKKKMTLRYLIFESNGIIARASLCSSIISRVLIEGLRNDEADQ